MRRKLVKFSTTHFILFDIFIFLLPYSPSLSFCDYLTFAYFYIFIYILRHTEIEQKENLLYPEEKLIALLIERPLIHPDVYVPWLCAIVIQITQGSYHLFNLSLSRPIHRHTNLSLPALDLKPDLAYSVSRQNNL